MGGRRDGRRGTRYTDAEKALARFIGIRVEHLGLHKITNVRWLEAGVIGANVSMVVKSFVTNIEVPIHCFNVPEPSPDGMIEIKGGAKLTEADLVRAGTKPANQD